MSWAERQNLKQFGELVLALKSTRERSEQRGGGFTGPGAPCVFHQE
jgi:hypothetical protein